MIPSSSHQLDSHSSAQCLAVDLCICVHQLLDEGSMMAIRAAINLVMRGGQSRHPLHYC